jgi:hypothetical protein
MEAALPASTAEEVLQQLADIIKDVEDSLTTIPYVPSDWQNDGRIYPPQADSKRRVPDRPAVKRYRTRRHSVYIGENGSIEIQRLDGTIEVAKSGADGRGVWDL